MVLEWLEFTDLQIIKGSLLSKIDSNNKLIEECIKNNVKEDFTWIYDSNEEINDFLLRINNLMEREDKYFPLRILSCTLSQAIKQNKSK